MRHWATWAVALALGGAGPASALELVIWHDKGDDGLAMVAQMSELYRKTHPDVTVRSLSFPTEQWFSKSIAALNTNTAPDILFNDNSRIATVQSATRKLAPMDAVLSSMPAEDRRVLTDGDVAAASLDGHAIMMPFQRVITGWGVRKSWMQKANETFPITWEDTLRVARKLQAQEAKTYGIALQAGNAGSLLGGGIELFVLGSGAPHPIIDETAEVVIDRPEVARPTIEYLKLYTEYKLVAPDTVNHTFTDMYQMIEGSRAGMFRVGNWNVKKWDNEAIKGDYQVGPYPSFAGSEPGRMVVGSIRGMAVPAAGRNRDAAIEFVKFIVSQQAQQASLDNMGGVVRSDLDTSKVTPSLRPFLAPETKLQTDDFMSARFPWYEKLRDAYYKELIGAIGNPPANWDTWIKATATKLRAEVAQLNKKS